MASPSNPSSSREGDREPPNPSVVTADAIDKAIASSADVMNARINGIEKAFEVFQADLTRVPTLVDRQILALRELLTQQLTAVESKVEQLETGLDIRKESNKELIQNLRDLVFSKIEELASVTVERFAGVAAQFAERDTRTDQRAGDTKLAVDAAFAAAKEATAKIEAGFTKQIDAMVGMVDTKTANLAGGLGDLKDRVTGMENRTAGIISANMNNRGEREERRGIDNDSRGLVFGVIGIVIGMGALVMTLLTHLVK